VRVPLLQPALPVPCIAHVMAPGRALNERVATLRPTGGRDPTPPPQLKLACVMSGRRGPRAQSGSLPLPPPPPPPLRAAAPLWGDSYRAGWEGRGLGMMPFG
jgi:hypothetical protein